MTGTAPMAICTRGNPGTALLQRFRDEIVETLDFEIYDGCWIVTGRVRIENHDGDTQEALAKLVKGSTVLDEITFTLPARGDGGNFCVFLQAPVGIRGDAETVTLQCNSYNAGAYDASIIAHKTNLIIAHEHDWNEEAACGGD